MASVSSKSKDPATLTPEETAKPLLRPRPRRGCFGRRSYEFRNWPPVRSVGRAPGSFAFVQVTDPLGRATLE